MVTKTTKQEVATVARLAAPDFTSNSRFKNANNARMVAISALVCSVTRLARWLSSNISIPIGKYMTIGLKYIVAAFQSGVRKKDARKQALITAVTNVNTLTRRNRPIVKMA